MESISAVICAYTMDRWDELAAAVDALKSQAKEGDQIIVVSDHNDELLARAETEFTGVDVMPNKHTKGLSGARNTGIAAATGDLVLFLDDDALPMPGWLDGYRARFEEDPNIAAVGGAVRPNWDGGKAPSWFPVEFGWVVGCDYRGLPGSGADIRNPIGASMGLRRHALDDIEWFSEGMGRVGALPVGCEETELCIRLRQHEPSARIVRDTVPVVRHRVPLNRQTTKYFLSRCYHEGRSKAALSSLVGSEDGLSAERSYASKILVSGAGNYARQAIGGDIKAVGRLALLVAGFASTGAGFALKSLSSKNKGATT